MKPAERLRMAGGSGFGAVVARQQHEAADLLDEAHSALDSLALWVRLAPGTFKDQNRDKVLARADATLAKLRGDA